MGPCVTQSKVASTQESSFRGKPFGQARLQAVVTGRRDIAKLIEVAKGRIVIPGGGVKHPMCSPENEGVPVGEISQLARRTAYITNFSYQISAEFALQTQIVLVDVRRSEMGIDEVNSPTAERQES